MARIVQAIWTMSCTLRVLFTLALLSVGMGGTAMADAPEGATQVTGVAAKRAQTKDERRLTLEEHRKQGKRLISEKRKARIDSIKERRERLKKRLKGEPVVAPVPELDPNAAGLAIFLLVGASLMLRERQQHRV